MIVYLTCELGGGGKRKSRAVRRDLSGPQEWNGLRLRSSCHVA